VLDQITGPLREEGQMPVARLARPPAVVNLLQSKQAHCLQHPMARLMSLGIQRNERFRGQTRERIDHLGLGHVFSRDEDCRLHRRAAAENGQPL
jgi:predicted secreted protein